MILFKRVGESFDRIEGREWALLFLETLGVVAGILVAFELNEWAARRSQAARHQQIMERLFEESERDVATLRDIRDTMRAMSKTESQFAVMLSRGQCPPEGLWKAVLSVNKLPAFRAPRTVYQELMGSGGLSSISNPNVRKAIADFNSVLEWSQSQNDYFRGSTVLHHALEVGDRRMELRYDPNADDPETAVFARQSLCGDPAFRSRMVDATRNHVVAASWHDAVTEDAIYMCGVLGENLGKRCVPSFGGDLVGADAGMLRKAIADARKPAD